MEMTVLLPCLRAVVELAQGYTGGQRGRGGGLLGQRTGWWPVHTTQKRTWVWLSLPGASSGHSLSSDDVRGKGGGTSLVQ